MRSRPFAPILLAAALVAASPLAAADEDAAPAAETAATAAPDDATAAKADDDAGAPAAGATAAGSAEEGTAKPEEPKKAPQLVVAEPVRDLGRIERGEHGEAEFTIENHGDATLRIKSAQPSCGCTVASFDAVIEPGASGRVRASLDTTTLQGAVAKTIVVMSNDPESPRAVLTLKAEIVTFVTVTPSFARLLQVQSQPTTPAIVSLWSGDGTPLEVLDVKTPERWIEATARRAEPAERRPEGPEEQWRIEVSLTPDAPLGPLTEALEVRTSHPRQRQVEIPLSGFVRAVLTPAPAVADFGNLGREVRDKSKFVLKLFNFGADPIEIKSAASDLGFISVVTAAEDPGRRFRVELRLAPDAPKGKFSGTLRLETTSPTMPVVEVPVRGKIG